MTHKNIADLGELLAQFGEASVDDQNALLHFVNKAAEADKLSMVKGFAVIAQMVREAE